jgi:hypothetical protein
MPGDEEKGEGGQKEELTSLSTVMMMTPGFEEKIPLYMSLKYISENYDLVNSFFNGKSNMSWLPSELRYQPVGLKEIPKLRWEKPQSWSIACQIILQDMYQYADKNPQIYKFLGDTLEAGLSLEKISISRGGVSQAKDFVLSVISRLDPQKAQKMLGMKMQTMAEEKKDSDEFTFLLQECVRLDEKDSSSKPEVVNFINHYLGMLAVNTNPNNNILDRLHETKNRYPSG